MRFRTQRLLRTRTRRRVYTRVQGVYTGAWQRWRVYTRVQGVYTPVYTRVHGWQRRRVYTRVQGVYRCTLDLLVIALWSNEWRLCYCVDRLPRTAWKASTQPLPSPHAPTAQQATTTSTRTQQHACDDDAHVRDDSYQVERPQRKLHRVGPNCGPTLRL